MTRKDDNAVRLASVMAGGSAALALLLDVSQQVVNRWIAQGWAPKKRARTMSDKFGIAIERLLDPSTLSTLTSARPDQSNGKASLNLLTPVRLTENQAKQFAIINFSRENGIQLNNLLSEMNTSGQVKAFVDLTAALLQFIQNGKELTQEQTELLHIAMIAKSTMTT